MTLEEREKRASWARTVLDNPAYVEAVKKISDDIRSLRLQVSPKDVEGIARLVFMEQATERAKWLMEQYLIDGEAAKKELDAEVQPGPIGRIANRFRRVSTL